MSGHGKAQGDPYDYDGSRSGQQASFAQPPYSAYAPLLENVASHGPQAQLPYLGDFSFDPNATFDAHQAAFSQIPDIQVTSLQPTEGPAGTLIYIYLTSSFDLSLLPCIVMVGSYRCQTNFTKFKGTDNSTVYQFSIGTPPFSATGWTDSEVPISMRFGDPASQNLRAVEVGTFNYVGPQTYESAANLVHKRKISTESTDYMRSPAKRVSDQQLRLSAGDDYTNYSSAGSPYSTYATSDSYSFAGSYDVGQSSMSFQPPASHQLSRQYSNTSAMSQTNLRMQSPSAATWSPSQSSQSSHSPALAAVSGRRLEAPSPSTNNPTLIRTSTLTHSPSPGNTPSAAQAFNPYAIYPHKAVLKIDGDLNAMADNWSVEERDTKRRLVQFGRQQNGSVITTYFEPVTPEQRQQNGICISCIWWEEKQECYVTSVDTIYLLESLVAVRFTVEEKNRIRRNLEGFHPLTVSKGRPESEEFFKVIMGFPAPKPRNIEKDVKVFPWKILSHALKKIIGKYSASYSSTAGPLLTPGPASAYGSGESSAGDHQYSASPRSVGSTPTLYAGHLGSGASPSSQLVAVPGDMRAYMGQADAMSGQPGQWVQQAQLYQSLGSPMTSQGDNLAYGAYLATTAPTSQPGRHSWSGA